MKVSNESNYKLIFSISEHPQLGVLIYPYVVEITSQNTLSLTYQKVFSGNASYYTKLSATQLDKISQLDDIMIENIIRRYSTKKKIRPKEYFRKYFDKSQFKNEIRPYIEDSISRLFDTAHSESISLYEADEINPAAIPVSIQPDFAKVLFHFRKNENGTSYFITLKYDNERIPFMKQGALLLTQKPARLTVHGKAYKFYDFVEGNKLSVFLNKKYIHIKPEREKIYYETFVTRLLETAPVFAQGFDIVNKKTEATPVLCLTNVDEEYIFQFRVNYENKSYPYEGNKLFHVNLEWNNKEPRYTRYKRSKIWEANRIKALESLGLRLGNDNCLRLKDTSLSKAIDWLREHRDALIAGHFVITQQSNLSFSLETPKIRYNISDKIDWFDLDIEVTIGVYKISFKQIAREIKNGNCTVSLPNGEVFVIPQEWFALGEGLNNASVKEGIYSIKKYQLDVLGLLKSDKIKEHLNRVINIKKEKPHSSFKGKLRPYQVDGLSWLMFLKNNNFGGILADDMGLGKTVQTLAFLQKVKMESSNLNNHPFLLVAPTSLLYNWTQETQHFSPNISVHIHSGTNRAKEFLQMQKSDLIITTYGLMRNDLELFSSHEFEIIILDESQNIKNHTAKTTQAISKVKANCKVALTGTPIENSIRDLWSQMNFLNKGFLGSLKTFEDKYAKPIEQEEDKEKAIELQQLVKPFLLRRTKEEVAKDLPPITEKMIFCEMTEEQYKVYEEVKSEYRNSILNIVEDKGISKSKLSILQGLSKLRQIANHPKLTDKSYIGSSGKHQIILSKIKIAIEEGHKLLVFSQFVSYLKILQADLEKDNIPLYTLTGATSKSQRAKRVETFQKQGSPAAFLISLKAGGTGLNLTSANYVFIVDPWWNPAAEAQARDRTHRIGQTRNVISYKFLTQGTIEEKISHLQHKKRTYSKDIIVSENNILTNLDINELNNLLT